MTEEVVLRKIFEWWKRSGRQNYPWREEKDIYKSAVAEVLLTRTKRKAVEKVYQEFIDKFPTAHDLANASESEIKEVIGRLGLRKRAKILKKLGKYLSEKKLISPEELENIPGIGAYGREILSLKLFGKGDLPVDKVVARVISRLFLGREPKGEKPEKDPEVLEIARRLSNLSNSNILDLAYALMDFGDKICKPRKPDCWGCPVARFCPFRGQEEYH